MPTQAQPHSMKLVLIIHLLFGTLCASAQATIFYVQAPSASNVWNNARNWNPNRIPNANDIVEVGNGHTVILSGSDATIKALEIRAQAKLVIADADVRLDIEGSDTDGMRLTFKGELDIQAGTVAIRNAQRDGVYMENFSKITNSGSLLISTYNDEGLYFKTNSTITNHGNLFIDQLNNGASPTCLYGFDGSFTNSATGILVISKCQDSPTTDLIRMNDGVLFEDHGKTTVHAINCN